MNEACRSSDMIYRGRIVNLRVDEVTLPNGKTAERSVVEHAPAVGVLAETERGDIFLVRQFRYPVGKMLLEVPAGIVEEGEEPRETAHRELQEEIGFAADELEEVARFYTSPGFSDELLILYHAQGLTRSSLEGDDDEFIDIVRVSSEEIPQLLARNAVEDGKTLTALFWLLCTRRR